MLVEESVLERTAVRPPASAIAGKPRESRRRKRPQKSAAEIGREGEGIAAQFLERRGYDLLERNWKCSAGEADIIARDEDAIVFVEVKTRSDCEKGLPTETVTKAKRERYERIAGFYLASHDLGDARIRFDIVGILVIPPNRALIRHHIDAFGRE